MTANINHLQYQPAPEKPADFDKQLLKIVGVCPNNVDPYLRFVWGMDVVENYGSEQMCRYPDPDDKYIGLPFWILEGWQSPDVYDRAEWEQNKDILGDFPTRGVWDFIEVYRTDDYQYLPLNSFALEKAREWKFWKSKGNKRAVFDLIEQREKIAALKDSRREARKKEINDNFIKRYTDAVNHQKNAAFSIPNSNNNGAFRETESGLLIPNH